MMARFILALIAALLLALPAQAAETIHQYDVRMAVAADGTLAVTETIDITAEGTDIRHGILRNLPLHRRMPLGGILPADYKIISVKRNGTDEPYSELSDALDLSLRIGNPSGTLAPGRHRYEIVYTIPGQIGFFNAYDELHWNAIGTEWIFPIERATATVILPDGAPITRHAAYTGAVMATGTDYTVQQTSGQITFTAGPFAPREGLTVAVAWPKGHIQGAPTPFAFLLAQHPGLPLLLAAMMVTLAYYAWAWRRHGRDPRQRSLTPFFKAPAHISPALAAYIQTLGAANPNRLLAAATISLAAKGLLSIEEEEKRTFTVATTPGGKGSPAPDERVILDAIPGRLSLSKHSTQWRNIASAHAGALHKLGGAQYFKRNTVLWLLGWLPLFAAIAFKGWTQIEAISHIIVLSLTLIAVGEFVRVFIVDKGRRYMNARYAFTILLLGGVFIFLYGTLMLRADESLLLALPLSVMVLAICMTRHAMKSLTPQGASIVEHVNGLQYYMTMVEEKVLKAFDPPQMSRELYEEFLPYAVALGVESKWGEKFETHVADATAGGTGVRAATYRPSWYRSTAVAGAGAFTAAMMITSFNRALSAATSTPSGGGGGGSSGGGRVGGGGGGGGGRGW